MFRALALACAVVALAGCGQAAERHETLTKTCIAKFRPGSEVELVGIRVAERTVDAALAAEGVEREAQLTVEYRQRRSADQPWDIWVEGIMLRVVAGRMMLSRGAEPFDPARICATE